MQAFLSDLRCRHKASEASPWAHLPLELVHRIIDCAVTGQDGCVTLDGIKVLMTLRQVSKFWPQVIKAYPFKGSQADSFEEIFKGAALPQAVAVLPGMVKMTIYLKQGDSLQSSAHCTQLSSLTVRGVDKDTVVDLRPLPTSVTELHLRRVVLDDACLKQASHLPITRFQFNARWHGLHSWRPSAFEALPRCLTLLRVRF